MTGIVLALVAAAAPASFVPPPPGELRGQVTRADGAPVPRFTVNGVAFEDPEGRFRILTPPEGEFRVVVRADGFAPNVFHVQGASGKKLVVPEIKLGAGEHVLGEVVDATTGDPVPLARATLADPAKLERLRFIRPERVAGLGVTGNGGYFELRRAPRGLLVLVVQHPDYLPEFVPVNTRSPLAPVRLHRGGNVIGTVRDVKGVPLPGVHVVAISEEAGDGAETNADVHGRFEMARLRPGSYRMIAVAQGKAVEGGRVDVADGQVAEVAISVKARAKQVELPTIELGLGAAPRDAIASR
ncbi:MAG TPA: carboxypeptidase-like regulatory domain-containing protein [Anaeromyxobacter sp.]